MIGIVAAILGLAVVPLLPVDLNPAVKEPKLLVTYSLPNAAPAVVESEATSMLENVFSQLSGLDRIYSVSNYNQGSIELTFDKNEDLDFKRFEVAAIIRQVRKKLPPGLTYPQISQGSKDDDKKNDPLIVYRLSAAIAGNQLKALAKDNISNKLAYLDGIKKIEVRGAEDMQITVRFDNLKLEKYKVDLQVIKQLIAERFNDHYIGVVDTEDQMNFFLRAGQSLLSIGQLQNLVVKNEEIPIRLKDMADIYLEESEPGLYYRVNGLTSITLSVYAQEEVNKITLADRVYEQIDHLKEVLPVGYEIIKDYDQTEFLREELDKIYKRAGLSIAILTLFIFLINRNWQYLVVLLSGVFINLSITSLGAYLLGIQIHLYTIAGITIAFGLIVDNTMVMVDHLHRKHNMRIFSALLGASLTTIMALLLVFFLPESDKKNLVEFAEIIALSLFVSLLIALFYSPAITTLLGVNKQRKVIPFAQRRGRVRKYKWYLHGISFLGKYRKAFLLVLILGFGTPVFLLPTSIENRPFYNKTIGSDIYQEQIRPYTDPLLGGALRLFVRDVFERSGYRTPEKTRLYVQASLPYGSTLNQVNDVIQKVEDYLKSVEGVSQFVAQVYSERYGSIQIEFDEEVEQSALPYQLKSRLIARSLDWGGVEWNVYGVGRGFSNSNSDGLPSFRVLLKGYNYDELEKQAMSIREKLLEHKRIQEVNINERLSWNEESTEEFTLGFDSRQLLLAGVSSGAIKTNIDNLTKNYTPGLFVNYNQLNTPVFFNEKNSGSFSKFDVLAKNLITGNRLVNLKPMATLTKQKTASAIHKEDRQYIRVVGFEYFGSSKFGNQYLNDVLDQYDKEKPLGYEAEKLSWEWDWGTTKRQYGLIVILLVGIYFICSILFENFKQPFYIIASVPISFIGLFLIFSIFDFYFDQGGYAAFVLLGGLVVNAAIFVINDLNNYHIGRYNRNVIKAILGKAQPILLTILSTCFGLIPFLIEGQKEVFWFSLAIGTIGGLLFSLIAVFVCLPVFLYRK